MLGILEIFILLNIESVFIECLIPHLNVRKLDKKFIAQKRQDTLDMCRIFNAETEKMKYYTPMLEKHHDIEKKHYRSKRSVVPVNIVNPALNDEDADRIEKIVDKIYDDLQENGEGLAYRQPKNQASASKYTPNKAARRFNFAPAELVGPDERHLPQKAIKDQPEPSGKIPRFKYGVVPYFIDSKTYDLHLSEIIVKAFDYIEKATCIRLQRLRERPTDTDSLRNVTWIYITNPLGIRQCVHSNERIDIQGVQMIVFGYDCMSLGGIIHEIMHVLGFSHEHSRPDRDQYITILWENIKPGYKKYFEIIDNSAVESLPYDYASVLHYPSRAFSRNGQVTILTEPGIKVGQREGFSELDVEKINTLYSAECVKRNREYLLKTCPVVVKAGTPTQKNMTEDDIYNFFKDRLWLYGIVNYRIKDKMEFTSEERENINAVISHIEKETCIEFRDLTPDSDGNSDDSSDEDDEIDPYLNANVTQNSTVKEKQMIYGLVHTTLDGEIPNQSANEINMSDNDHEGTTATDRSRRMKNTVGSFRKRSGLTEGQKQNMGSRAKRGAVRSPLRRHMNNVIVLTRSAEPGCVCPLPGKPDGVKVLNINSDCFNSVNDLLHLFVHVLGLDHQHNMHDRDSYLHIVWDELTPDIRDEMSNKLPPAASVGFPYDYQSVMHYPWLQIKNGRTNMMYPIWNDGWAMGHWQGLSSTDVQKLNLLYNEQCAERKRLAANAGKPK